MASEPGVLWEGCAVGAALCGVHCGGSNVGVPLWGLVFMMIVCIAGKPECVWLGKFIAFDAPMSFALLKPIVARVASAC